MNIPLTINWGDIISAEVSYSGGKFTVSLTDLTDCSNGISPCAWSQSEKMPDAKRASAEWIVEAPGAAQPLSKFVPVTFDYCSATVGGVPDPIAALPWIEITMVASNGATMALPSTPSADTFVDTWKSAGP